MPTNTNSPKSQKIKVGLDGNILEALRKQNPKLFRLIATSQEEQMNYLNSRIGQVKIGGKVRYFDNEDSEVVFYNAMDMGLLLAHETVLTWDQERKAAFAWWQHADDRKQYSRVIFEPDRTKVKPDEFNLFKGFPIPPKKAEGGWRKFRAHLLDNVCNGNQAHYNYLEKWIASLFKKPGGKIGVALILQGEMGTGKSVVGEILAMCLGSRYCPVVDTPEGLTGKHNRHLATALLVRAEEALNPRDPRHESRLRHMITGGTFMIEPKGIDAFEVESKSNMIFTTNRPHVVPAFGGERRFFCLKVASHQMQNRKYFRDIFEEMKAGGAAAFIYDMLRVDLADFDLEAPPATDLLATQIMESMTGLERWWAEVLAAGRLPWRGEATGHLPHGHDRAEADKLLEWPEAGGWTTHCSVVAASAADHVRTYAGSPSAEAVGKFLGSAIPDLLRGRVQEEGERHRTYTFPSLEECRRAFVEARRGLTLESVGGVNGVLVASDLPKSANAGCTPQPLRYQSPPRPRPQQRPRAIAA